MQWPSSITLRFVSARSGRSVGGLIVYVVIPARRKNDYPLGPFVSDSKGEVLLERRQVVEQVTSLQMQAPMDYGHDLEDLLGAVRVEVDSAQDLVRRIQAIAEWYPERAQHLSQLVKRSSNAQYETTRELVTVSSGPIVLTVHEKVPIRD